MSFLNNDETTRWFIRYRRFFDSIKALSFAEFSAYQRTGITPCETPALPHL